MEIKVKKIELFEVKLPLKEPFQISSAIIYDRRFLLIKQTDHNGLVAWSECVAKAIPNYMPEIIDTAWIIIRDHIAPLTLNTPFTHPSQVTSLLATPIKGNFMAKASVEVGIWTLFSIANEMSLAAYIGATQTKIPTGISIGIQDDVDLLCYRVEKALKEGYHKIKIKIKPTKDISYIRKVRETFGDDCNIMVDANSAYTLKDQKKLKILDDFNLMMIEQPLAWDNVLEHADLQANIKTPICLDESITNYDRAKEMIDHQCGKIINIKLGRVGGFQSALAIHDLAQQFNIPVWCGGMLESGIGRAYNVALAGLPNFRIAGDISPSSRYWQKDIIAPEWCMDDQGMLSVPFDTIGLGVEVKETEIKDLCVRHDIIL